MNRLFTFDKKKSKCYPKGEEGETIEKPTLLLPRWEELPDLELYADQVVSYLEKWLKPFSVDDEKVITKSMINNYVKHGLVSAPKNKKYARNHLAYLIVVCIFKQVYTMQEITQMISIQVHTYPTDYSYNSFIEEFESCAQSLFESGRVQHLEQEGESELSKLLHVVVESVVTRIYVQKNLEKRRKSDTANN